MLNKSRVWLLQLVSFLVGLRTYQHPLVVFKSGALALAASGLPLTAEGLVRSRSSPCEISSGQSGIGTGFPLGRLRLKCDGTRAKTRFRLSAKRTSSFKSAGASVQSTTGSRGVRISGSTAGCTMFRGSVRVMATHSIRQFPLHFPSRASPCAITLQLDST